MINKYFDKNERNSARKNLRHTLKLLQLNYISYLKKENLYEEVMQMEEKKAPISTIMKITTMTMKKFKSLKI